MAKISAADVKKLRDMTGAGMMDCKKALEESEGDFDKAVEILRKKGQKVANKRSDRELNEGVVLAKTSDDNKKAYIVALACETDFVARTDDFKGAVETILEAAIKNDAVDTEALKNVKLDNGLTVADQVTELSGKTGEKVELAYYNRVEGEYAAVYVHFNLTSAAIAAFNKPASEEVAKDIVMQIVSMKPVAIDKDEVPQEIVDKELEIGKEQAINEGKPADIAEKIAQGRLNKFFKEYTLLNQAFIKDNKMTVRDYLKQSDPELKVVAIARYSVHE